jgi:hypothetical protein
VLLAYWEPGARDRRGGPEAWRLGSSLEPLAYSSSKPF